MSTNPETITKSPPEALAEDDIPLDDAFPLSSQLDSTIPHNPTPEQKRKSKLPAIDGYTYPLY